MCDLVAVTNLVVSTDDSRLGQVPKELPTLYLLGQVPKELPTLYLYCWCKSYYGLNALPVTQLSLSVTVDLTCLHYSYPPVFTRPC